MPRFATSSPTLPFSAVVTAYPSISSISARLRRMGAWSSMIRIRFFTGGCGLRRSWAAVQAAGRRYPTKVGVPPTRSLIS